jgi:hypothetical protein
VAGEAKTNVIYAIGIVIRNGLLEIYAVNKLNHLMLHGWFDPQAGFIMKRLVTLWWKCRRRLNI